MAAQAQEVENGWLTAGYRRQDSAMAVAGILRRLAYARRLLTVNASQPAQACAIRVRAWDGACAELVAEWPEVGAIAGNPVEFAAVLDAVHYRFFAEIRPDRDTDGAPLLRVRLPQTLFVLQRRDDFRLTGTSDGPLTGSAWLDGRQIAFEIVDVSAGGIRIGLQEDTAIQAGARLERCCMELPGEGPLAFGLEIRHVEAGPPPLLWAGCRFIHLPGAQRVRLTRYLLERQRAQRSEPPASAPVS